MSNKQAQDIMNGVGAMAEMTYLFYKTMVEQGAEHTIATVAMCAFITGLVNASGSGKQEE